MFLCAENQDVGLNTYALQFLDGVLGRLGLQLASCFQIGHVGKVHIESILAQFPFQLSDGFHIWSTLYVAYSATNLCDDKVVVILLPQQFYIAFYLVGDVRNYLYGFAKIVATSFLVDNSLVDTSCSERVGLCCLDARESFVMTEVKIRFHSIYRHIALTMLVWIECARIDVDVWVKLLNCNVVAPGLQKLSDG